MPSASARPRMRPVADVGAYFTKPTGELGFISSGCALLDCALGGGYPLGRVVNIVGDKSTGKTLLAIEAIANFYKRWRQGHAWYCETEAAFDNNYARALGIDIDRVLRPKSHVRTVEQFFAHLELAIKNRGDLPGLYILDSLDALSDEAELKREFGDSSFGAQKAKKMSEAFRRVIRLVEDSRTAVMIISQVRDNIGVTFGRKHTRSGGRALDFYASQILYLAHLKTLKRTMRKVERVVGVRVRAKVDKNKIGLPLRECEFPIRFGYGIDDVAANIEWLTEVNAIEAVTSLKGVNLKVVMSQLDSMDEREFNTLRNETQKAVRDTWSQVEQRFIPKRAKYNGG
jgi:recombination protein RecA